jgi:hypothetical protein
MAKKQPEPVADKEAYYAALLAEKIAAGLSKEDAATVVKGQREEDEKAAEQEPG